MWLFLRSRSKPFPRTLLNFLLAMDLWYWSLDKQAYKVSPIIISLAPNESLLQWNRTAEGKNEVKFRILLKIRNVCLWDPTCALHCRMKLEWISFKAHQQQINLYLQYFRFLWKLYLFLGKKMSVLFDQEPFSRFYNKDFDDLERSHRKNTEPHVRRPAFWQSQFCHRQS